MEHLFPDLNEEELRSFQGYTTSHRAKVGEILVELGSNDRDLYILTKGSCEVYQKFVLGGKLFALRVGTLDAPVMLGEANLLLGKRRNATIIVSADMTYSKLSYDNFCKIKEEDQSLAIKLLEQIGKVATGRFMDMQQTMLEKFLAETPQPVTGLKYLKKFMGNALPCSPRLAEKLFNMEQPSFDEGNDHPFHYEDERVK